MTSVLQFVRGGVTRSLQDSTAGMQILDGAWTPQIARPAHGRIPADLLEQMPIWVKDSTNDDLAEELQEFAEMQKWAADFMSDRRNETPVWLQDKTDTETNQRQALVKSIVGNFSSSWHASADIQDSQVNIPMVVTRHPYWEAATATAEVLDTTVGERGDPVNYTVSPGADVVGDVPARVKLLRILGSVAADAGAEHAWLGFRSAKNGRNPANFVPVWDCEDGTNAIADTTDAADANAYSGNTVQTTFATQAGWAKRFSWLLSDITANESDQYGRHLVLFCARMSDTGATAEIKLRIGNYVATSDPVYTESQIVEVSSTTYRVLDGIGHLTIPVRNLQALTTSLYGDTNEQAYQIEVWARRTSGSASLLMDCMCLVPADEYIMSVEGMQLASSDYLAAIAVSPHEEIDVAEFRTSTTQFLFKPTITASGVGVPVGDGRLVGVFAEANKAIYNSTQVQLGLSYYPRWTSLRGAE